MIRVVQRRLIIPRGDTGSFTLPLLPGAVEGDVAIFSIYDPLYQKTVCTKKAEVSDETTLTFEFVHEDTATIEPSTRYEWDVRIYHNGTWDEDSQEVIIGAGTTIDSYYAAFRLPQCEIAVAP